MLKGKRHGIADIHLHSIASDGLAPIPELLEYVQNETGLDVIAITDHDCIEGSYQAREMAATGNYRFEVVVGMEVTNTDRGGYWEDQGYNWFSGL